METAITKQDILTAPFAPRIDAKLKYFDNFANDKSSEQWEEARN